MICEELGMRMYGWNHSNPYETVELFFSPLCRLQNHVKFFDQFAMQPPNIYIVEEVLRLISQLKLGIVWIWTIPVLIPYRFWVKKVCMV